MIGKTISHYHVLGQIGEGGMGVVYVAEDTRLGRRVAFKIPHAGRDERHYRARFLQEARAVSRLNHPNIAAVYDYGEGPDGQPYIVMELVAGQTLGDILTGPGLSLQRAVEIIGDVAEALAEAHRRGIVHRDVKPSNVIVNDRGEVKVLDFGLAKQLNDAPAAAGPSSPEAQTLLSTQTRSDVVIGTPLYLSPEQARGARVDGRSDLFALGALLYECVAGRPAFSGSNVIEIGAQVLHVDPPPPSHYNPRVPAELDRLVLKALAKKPEDRFQTAEEMAAELARVGARIAGADTVRTRRLATGPHAMRTSALTTLTQNLRRPRFSPLALVAALAVALLSVWAVARWTRPRMHEPPPEAVRHFAEGVKAVHDGAFYRASLLFKEAIGIDDRYVLAYARLAEAKYEMDYLDAAKDDLLTVQSLVERDALPGHDRLYLDAVVATVRRDYPAAVAAYRRLAELDRDSARVHVDLGRALERNNQTGQAISSYTEAATRDPFYATAHLRLGVLHARQKNLAGALQNFERAEKLYAAPPASPDVPDLEGLAEVSYQRGRLFIEQGKQAEARRELERALELAGKVKNLHQQVRVNLQYSYLEAEPAASARAQGAVETAEANGMHDQVTYGQSTLGNLALTKRNDRAEAERLYKRALDTARAHRIKRYEAFALVNLGNLYVLQNRLDEAQPLVERALEFYREGGYHREASSSTVVLVRIQRKRGDNEGALRVLEEQLRAAEQVGDIQQIGFLSMERGLVLQAQERLPQALASYSESLKIYKQLGDQAMIPYGLLNTAILQRRMGRFDEMRASLAQAAEALAALGIKTGDLAASLLVTEAEADLSQGRPAEAAAKARRAEALSPVTNSRPTGTQFEIKLARCRAEATAGAGGRGVALCEEAVSEADAAGDAATAAAAHLALSEARLAAGDARGALAEVPAALDSLTRLGRVESEWRALAVAAAAARRAGDTETERAYTARAAEALRRLEEIWGADVFTTFLTRPDVRALNRAPAPSDVAR
jgi:tetratricopeptide (TPR) repeat protein/tRNA A-37 threonylcarbamoyl transferase component Bud32